MCSDIIVIALVVVYEELYCCNCTCGGIWYACLSWVNSDFFVLLSTADNRRYREVSSMPGKRRVGKNVHMSNQLSSGGEHMDPINLSGHPYKVRDSAVWSSRDGSPDLRRRLDKHNSGRGRSECAKRDPSSELNKTVKRPGVRRLRPTKPSDNDTTIAAPVSDEWKEEGEMGYLGSIHTKPLRRGKLATKASTTAKEKENYIK